MEPKLFYQQPAARVGDVIPQYIDGKYQLFYLKNCLFLMKNWQREMKSLSNTVGD